MESQNGTFSSYFAVPFRLVFCKFIKKLSDVYKKSSNYDRVMISLLNFAADNIKSFLVFSFIEKDEKSCLKDDKR